MMREVLAGLPQLDLGNTAAQTELIKAHEHCEERFRHDRDTSRSKTEETARRVAYATAAARMSTMPFVLTSVDTKLLSKPGTFCGKHAEWPRWSQTQRAYLGAVLGWMLELLWSAEDT